MNMYVQEILIFLFSCGIVRAQQITFGTPNNNNQGSNVLDNLQNIGALQNPINPCNGINCGYGRYCSVVNIGTSSRRTYQCQYSPTPPPVSAPQCYDKVEIRVPATNNLMGSAAGASAAGFARPCQNQCQSDRNCARGQICCMQGCDRICYRPKTTIVDYTVTTQYPLGAVFG